MKYKLVYYCLSFLFTLNLSAQHMGNYSSEEMISRKNIAHGGNAQIYNPTVNQNINRPLNPTNTIIIDVKALQNVKASSYTAIFNLSQIGETAQEANQLSNERIDNVREALKDVGITEDQVVIDVISFVPVYEIEVEKKLFSKKYNEVPKGFELQQNIHIQFSNTSQFQHILTACADNEIYNLVKVDYFIENISTIYKSLQTELLKQVEEKKAYYKVLGFDVNTKYDAFIADNKYCFFPKNFYKNYQAYNSISFEAIKKKHGVTNVKKQTSFYYDPLSYEDYDVVINPAILEPVVQVGMHIKLMYTPIKPKEEIKPVVTKDIDRKYYVISPNGAIDIKELATN